MQVVSLFEAFNNLLGDWMETLPLLSLFDMEGWVGVYMDGVIYGWPLKYLSWNGIFTVLRRLKFPLSFDLIVQKDNLLSICTWYQTVQMLPSHLKKSVFTFICPTFTLCKTLQKLQNSLLILAALAARYIPLVVVSQSVSDYHTYTYMYMSWYMHTGTLVMREDWWLLEWWGVMGTLC